MNYAKHLIVLTSVALQAIGTPSRDSEIKANPVYVEKVVDGTYSELLSLFTGLMSPIVAEVLRSKFTLTSAKLQRTALGEKKPSPEKDQSEGKIHGPDSLEKGPDASFGSYVIGYRMGL